MKAYLYDLIFYIQPLAKCILSSYCKSMPAKYLQRIAEGETYCHVYNKGIENRTIFADDADYQVFLGFLEDYLSTPKTHDAAKKEFTINGRIFSGLPHQPKNYFNKVELITYSLKPDHFHLLLHQKTKNSLQAFIKSLSTRYSIYFNKKYNRTGALFAGPYKSVQVKDEKNILLLTRYLHSAGGYSSYPEYSGQRKTPWVMTKGKYKDNIEKFEPNQMEKGLLEEIVIENVDSHLERRDLEQVNLKPWVRIPELVISSATFVLLFGFGLKNVMVNNNFQAISLDTLGTKTSSTSVLPSDSSQSKTMLTVKNSDITVPVNILRESTSEAEIVSEAYDGDTLEFVSEDSGWYEVKLPDGSTGFILSRYLETGEISN